MPDIDYTRNTESGFFISLKDNPRKAVGNKALANRFEITFLTNTQNYLLGENIVTDGFGGEAERIVGTPQSLDNSQGMASSLTLVINKTVESLIGNQSSISDSKERIVSATLVSLDISGDTVSATIELVPEEYEDSYPLYYSLPIRGT